MIVGKAIYYLLTNATDVTDIVSTRVYPEVAQQDADLPFIVYNVTNNEPSDTKPEPSKLDTAQVEVNIYSDSYTEAIDLAVAVRAALDRVKGTYNGVNVQSIQYQNEVIDFDEPQRAYNISADYDVRISRSGFEIAQGSPITGVQLGELSDVDVTGVTNGQLIAYNSTSGNWEAANDAGGANELSDLSDANVSLPSDGEVLIYSGGEFVNDNIAISNVTGLQAALDAAPDNLRELTDVTISGLADNDYLQYDSASGTWQNSSLILGRNGEQYTGNYDSEAETLLDGATETVELYYTAQADGDGLHEDAQTDTATTGYDIRRKLYYAEKAQANPNTSGDWTQFADIADDTTYASAKATLLAYLKARTGGTVPISLKMTWEEVAQAPAFTGLLNESYGSGAAAAYSVRRLNGNYTGAAIQVERSSDNTTQDIGFDSNGDLDESALTTFCTGTTCRVRTWYDQATAGGTGSGNDAVQTTHANQPTIYTGGAIVKLDGRAAVKGLGVSGGKLDFTTVSHTGNFSHYMLQTFQSNAMPYGGPSGHFWYHMNANTLRYRIDGASEDFGGYQFQNLQRFLHSGNRGLSAGNLKLAIDGIDNATSNASTQTFDLSTMYAGNGGGFPYSGYIQEFLMYDSSKSASDQDSIESNVGDYFTQNTPLLDTYTGAAAAYSLRKLRTAYTGSAIRVRRASDNTESDIGFNVFGELDTVSLASFCSGTNGFVAKWYDQASTNDATQSTTANQPKIYDSVTGVVTENGKPIMNDPEQGEIFSASFTGNSSATICSVLTGSNGYQDIFLKSGSNYYFRTQSDVTTVGSYVNGIGTVTTYANGSLQGNLSRKEANDLVENSQTNLFATCDLSGFTNLIMGTSSRGGMNMQEVIIWNSDQSSNRTNIEDNINTFYSIY